MADYYDQWSEEQLQQWYRAHGPEVARKPVFRSQQVKVTDPITKLPEYKTEQTQVGEEITARDGTTIELKRNAKSGQPGQPDYDLIAHEEPAAKLPPPRTAEQTRIDVASAAKTEYDNARSVQENNERSWNQNNTAEGGSGRPETHLERAEREAKLREEARRDEAAARDREASARATAAQEASNREATATREQRARDEAAQRGLTQQEIDIRNRAENRQANQPTFLSQADAKSPNITRYNPQTGQIESQANPNYDAIKAAAEEKRAEMATLIEQRRITLQEAQQQYTQWFDGNVKTPLLLAQEARSRAEEQRQALDAEERRNQFAADFGLRKATLGESASARAVQAEQSLLPYRAGPTESAEMSSAINSLAAGGKVAGPDAGAGVHFTPGAFEFDAPDFAGIAKQAAKQVLSGLTDYRPSDEKYQRADYTNVPGVNLAGAPTLPGYSYPAPAPTP